MGEGIIFNKINNLLKSINYHGNVKSLPELIEFINDDENKELEVYDQIEELYSVLVLGQGMW